MARLCAVIHPKDPMRHPPEGAGGQGRAEVAGGEGVEGAEAFGEVGGGQLTVAEERAEIILGGAGTFPQIAIPAAGDEVAVGIVAGP